MAELAPSILSADFWRLGEEVGAVERGGAQWLHVDVMDGHFVPNITIGPLVVRALRGHTRMPLDVHLMISDADRYIPGFADAGADNLTVHVEACTHLHRNLEQIRALAHHGKDRVRAGVSLNPHTPIEAVIHVLELCDLVLVMTVNPGFGGQDYLATMEPKIAEVRAMVDATGRDIDIEVDGGISAATVKGAAAAGANVFVAGSALFGHPDGLGAAVAELRADATAAFPA